MDSSNLERLIILYLEDFFTIMTRQISVSSNNGCQFKKNYSKAYKDLINQVTLYNTDKYLEAIQLTNLCEYVLRPDKEHKFKIDRLEQLFPKCGQAHWTANFLPKWGERQMPTELRQCIKIKVLPWEDNDLG